jgi:hypothetical protein
MNVGFLRSSASMDELKEVMAALEKAGCERIVVDLSAILRAACSHWSLLVSRMEMDSSFGVWIRSQTRTQN